MKKGLENRFIEDELMVSLGLVWHGLYYLYWEDGTEDREFVLLYMLSGGFERLIKLIMTVESKIKNNLYLENEKLKEYQHKLSSLLNKVENLLKQYLHSTQIQSYKYLNELFAVLHNFSMDNRYQNFKKLEEGNRCNNKKEKDEKNLSYQKEFDNLIKVIIKDVSDNKKISENEIHAANVELIKNLFVITQNLVQLLEVINPKTKGMALIYKNKFNDFTRLLEVFENTKPIPLFDENSQI